MFLTQIQSYGAAANATRRATPEPGVVYEQVYKESVVGSCVSILIWARFCGQLSEP